MKQVLSPGMKNLTPSCRTPLSLLRRGAEGEVTFKAEGRREENFLVTSFFSSPYLLVR
ncbi:hypothetical protein QUB80_09680 [Chlorogloeopsis sp. ULAP01]|uniref:hypothetical protein n=1 Tax=Chlorogloeopsis sp. ULAP01 TaxID=3056483 RepID=UPI0025AB4BE0|nr:hypothetical protein [Chlorogloeopsis sp. ULAP01]MDM9380974.1 hypothetical protein [Chlorogloeopsis sp. ULAP01]